MPKKQTKSGTAVKKKTTKAAPTAVAVEEPPTPVPDPPIVTPPSDPLKSTIEEVRMVFRRKPLLVRAEQVHKKQVAQLSSLGVSVNLKPGDWIVDEGGHRTVVLMDDFDGLYEMVQAPDEEAAVAGLADMELGSTVDKDGKRMVRVKVIGGRGAIAYWHRQQNTGEGAHWEVIADMNDNPGASHRVGRFIEPFEGKPGTKTWAFLAVH